MPTHGFTEPIQLNIFIDGLRPQSKQLFDASAGGKIKLKTPEEEMELIDNKGTNQKKKLLNTWVENKKNSTRISTNIYLKGN